MSTLYDTSFLDTVRHRLPLSEVIGKRVNLKRRGVSTIGLCPFHNEKTPSFHVRDDKGFYHCFGCGAHGSIFDFLMKTESLNFPQALERAAGMAGVSLPVSTLENTKRKRTWELQKAPVFQTLKATTALYINNLEHNKVLKNYIANRGIKENSSKAFCLGYAKPNKEDLQRLIKTYDLSESSFVHAGLLGKDHRKNIYYPRFRDRLVFPIHDLKGRIVGFGGRVLKDGQQPKYLNSPDSEIFHKGQLLYGLYHIKKGWAEAQSMKKISKQFSTDLIIVEGYMDVIALQQAGFSAVAPLGTALTEDQVALAWQHTSTPTLCFDGDSAGQHAALRALERTLPLLRPGYTLNFITLPQGEDPDSLLTRGQHKTFEHLLNTALPLVDVWWKNLTSKAKISTPENKAHFKNYVYKQLEVIKDASVRESYRQEYSQRLYKLLNPYTPHATPLRRASTSIKLDTLNRVPQDTQACLILATLLHHPVLIEQVEHEAIHLPLDGQLKKFHTLLLDQIFQTSNLENYDLYTHLHNKGFDKLLEKLSNLEVYELAPFAHPKATLDEALKGWRSLWKNFAEVKELDQEIAVLANELKKNPSPKSWERLRELTEVRRSHQLPSNDGEDSEFEV